ncbi:MAG: hypothetical protein AAF704_13230 [Cyanobacteria bacterium P01_D01_bin.123]
MTAIQPTVLPSSDLAGDVLLNPHYLDTRRRINTLLDRYVAIDALSDCLSGIQAQFDAPQARRWERFKLRQIHPDQIIGIRPELFVQVLASAAEVEDPIRDYARESYHYLQPIHPQMARFMGGDIAPDGKAIALGVWEREERQHGPLFRKLHEKLSGQILQVVPNTVDGYQASTHPVEQAHRHTLGRISTEWGALSVYLWLMAHSTGELQQAIAQPLQDEIGHLAKFWGFSRWAFAAGFLHQLSGTTRNLLRLSQHHRGERTHGQDLFAMHLDRLQPSVEIGFTLARVMVYMRAWNRELTGSYLRHLFGGNRYWLQSA